VAARKSVGACSDRPTVSRFLATGPCRARVRRPRRVRLVRNRNEVQFTRYRAWQWIKHLALADYVWPWANKVGSRAWTIFVVDLFAGAGTYLDVLTGERSDGSPVIFARQAQRYAKKRPGRQLKVICVERNGKNAKSLIERVKGFGDIVTVLRGSFTRHIETILSTIGNAPALILFDPIGLKPISAETIRPLLHRTGKTDVFMVLHFKVLHRTAGMLLDTGHADPKRHGAAETALVFDGVFGTPRWRFIAKNPRYKTVEERERAYLDLYFETVLGDRYAWKCAYPVRAKYLAATQYWLVHASAHIDAHVLMNDEIVKLQEQLFMRTYEHDGTLPGIAEPEWKASIEAEEQRLAERMPALVQNAPGATMTFGAIRDALWPEFFGVVKEGAYSRAAKALFKEERLAREKKGIKPKIDFSERLSVPVPARPATSPAERAASRP
jgi:three-Cys-motif partner protein